MIKDELYHTHQLLAIIEEHLEEDRGVGVSEDEYGDVDTGPYEAYRNKQRHKEAVQALGQDVAAAIEAVEVTEEEEETEVRQ